MRDALMKIQLFAPLVLLLVLGCTNQTDEVSLVGDIRFVTSGPNLGLDGAEVLAKIGPPTKALEGGCTAPLFIEGEETEQVAGYAYLYMAEGPDAMAQLTICVVGKYVVAEQKQVYETVGGLTTLTIIETTDNDIVIKAVTEALLEGLNLDKDLILPGEEQNL